jgi:transposase
MQGTSDPTHVELLDAVAHCRHLVPDSSVHALLADHRKDLFPDQLFADLFPSVRGRPSVPADVVATVLVLQALEGLSDREACQQLACNIAWKVACGLALTDPGFHPTVLCLWRNRLRASQRPGRILEAVGQVIAQTGVLAGRRRRALDSTLLDPAGRCGRHPGHRHPVGGRDPAGASAGPSRRGAGVTRPRLRP